MHEVRDVVVSKLIFLDSLDLIQIDSLLRKSDVSTRGDIDYITSIKMKVTEDDEPRLQEINE